MFFGHLEQYSVGYCFVDKISEWSSCVDYLHENAIFPVGDHYWRDRLKMKRKKNDSFIIKMFHCDLQLLEIPTEESKNLLLWVENVRTYVLRLIKS